MHWAQAILFCGGLIYAAVDDLRTRTVSDIVCIVIALAGLITISPASLLGALLAMLPFYLCAGFGLMGGGDWRLAAAVGFVLGVGRVLTGFLFMSVALLLAYVPGFGYVDSSGDNTVIDGQDIYENGNKIGEMGGGN